MKMEGVSDLVNGHSEVKPHDVAKAVQPSPKDIGREFVRQYYTMLSERPQDVYRFYSHESFFLHDVEPPIQGQQKIQDAIERLSLTDCKARIFTVTGTATVANGLCIQVCGELMVGLTPSRRFVQTFILCPQTPKKYYVHNDVFQWLDRAFNDPIPEPYSQGNTTIDESLKEDLSLMTKSEISNLNGQLQNMMSSGDEEQRTTDLSDEAINISEEEHEEVLPTNEQIAYEETPTEESHQHEMIVEETVDENVIMPSADQEQVTTPSPQQTSWAKMVSSSVGAGPHTMQPYVRGTASAQSMARPVIPSQSVSSSAPPGPTNVGGFYQKDADSYGSGGVYPGSRYSQAETNCRLYIGNITRNLCPEKGEIAETEIKSVFERFGPVLSVKVPSKALEKHGSWSAYAFIIMKTPEGARNVFKAAKKDPDRASQYLLNIKLESFGFEGDVALSEQLGSQGKRPMFSNRGGPQMQGMSRGGYHRAGFGPRGGGRYYMKQYGSGGEHRFGNVHSQQEQQQQ